MTQASPIQMRCPLLLSLISIPLALGCSEQSRPTPGTLARPVTVIQLAEVTPRPSRFIPGIVTPYRQTEVPFRVTGRVERLVSVGDDVVGEQVDREGSLIQEGTVLAELDQAPFQRALNQARQRVVSAQLELESARIQLETVLPARVKSARSQAEAAELNAKFARDDVQALEAAVDLAQTTVERNRDLLPTGAVSDITVRQSEAELQAQQARLAQARTLVSARQKEHDAALATIAELEGNEILQQANNESLSANVKVLEEAVRDAESDLEHCVLRAPFAGRVTELHVGEGSFVQAGAPIVTLTMMTPIDIELTVSSTMEDSLVVGTDAVVYPTTGNEIDADRSVRATLYEKRGVADASTRTFVVGLIAPNSRRRPRAELADLPRAPFLIPIFENPLERPDGEGLFTLSEAVVGEGEDAWVMKVRGLAQGERTAESLQGSLQAERRPVRRGERVLQVASFTLVELVGAPDLGEGDLLVPDPTPQHADGFIVDDNRWLLRPGDLVQVSIDTVDASSGYYVPVQAIRELNGANHVFVVDESNTAASVPVEVFESRGELRRIASAELVEGARLVAAGAHFLQDGDQVLVTEERAR